MRILDQIKTHPKFKPAMRRLSEITPGIFGIPYVKVSPVIIVGAGQPELDASGRGVDLSQDPQDAVFYNIRFGGHGGIKNSHLRYAVGDFDGDGWDDLSITAKTVFVSAPNAEREQFLKRDLVLVGAPSIFNPEDVNPNWKCLCRISRFVDGGQSVVVGSVLDGATDAEFTIPLDAIEGRASKLYDLSKSKRVGIAQDLPFADLSR